jgi:hypothetical protein
MGFVRKKADQVGNIGQSVIDTAKDVGTFAVNTVSDAGSAIAEPLGGWTNVRDTLQAGGVVAGNYLLPGSGLVSSQLVSDGAKDALGSDLGKAAMIGSGVGGAYAGNLANYGNIGGAISGGVNAGPELLGDAGMVAGTGSGSSIGGGISSNVFGSGNIFGSGAPEALGEASGTWASTPAAGTGLLSTAANWASANPLQAANLGLTAAKALGGSTPSSSTTSTSIDPEMKAAYLRNLEEARTTAAGLGTRQYADFSGNYGTAEKQLRNLGIGGAGQAATAEAARLSALESGYTPQQIQAANAGQAQLAASQGYTPQQIQAAQANRANVQNVNGQIGAQYMGAYQNPFESQVVQGALGDIELARQRQGLTDRASATAAKAFGGSRQGVAESLTNEAALRNAASTASNLRMQGFNTAANLGQNDAARMLQANMANQGVDLSLEQANTQLRQQGLIFNQGAANQAMQFGAGATNQANLVNTAAQNQMAQYNASQLQQANIANQQANAQGAGIRLNAAGQMGNLASQQQNLGIAGSQAVMNAEAQRQALEQARLDAARNLSLERLGISQAALGLQPANLGGTQTNPIYKNTSASALGGALSGGMLGNMIGGASGAGYGAIAGGLLGLL